MRVSHRLLSVTTGVAAFLSISAGFAGPSLATDASARTGASFQVLSRDHTTVRPTVLAARKQESPAARDAEPWWRARRDDEPIQVVVSLDEQRAVVYAGGRPVAETHVSTGKSGHTTPTGVFSILQKARHHRSNIYSNAPMPFMQRLTWSGIALHASDSVPGYPASHGCVRLPHGFAGKLFKFTEIGAHVVIARRPVLPRRFDHPGLFRPGAVPEIPVATQPSGLAAGPATATETAPKTGTAPHRAATLRSLDGPEGRYPSGMQAEARQAKFDRTITLASLRLSRTDAEEPLISTAVETSSSPIRILVTRRTGRELVRDAQTLLNGLGYDAGEVDGWMGPITGSAIRAFQKDNGLDETGAMSPDLVTALHRVAGKGPARLGHIYVRQDFKELFDMPVALKDAEKALGTHFFTVIGTDAESDVLRWNAVSLNDRPKQSNFSFFKTLEEDGRAMTARAALDRIVIPPALNDKIAALLTPGSSFAITDNGLSRETGRGTDFVVLTRDR